ncbi:MAG TPA: alpha/beta hydrolase [Bacteroidia bacterium]|nr:alpha/beta hydrolase [Bacteroidia bacterium]HRG52782.1 alpha/beta hydrolase [Bacteroidia bacterium]
MKIKKNAIIALFFVFIISCISNPDSDKKDDQTTDPKEIKRDGAVIDYHITGKGDTTLLFVHGAFIDQTYWKQQVDYFSQHYIVVTLDLPGHGKSGKTRKNWALDGFANDVSDVINTLNLKNVVLIGHSMAGDINLIVSSHMSSPIIGFIGIDNFKEAGTPIPDVYKPMVDSIRRAMFSDFENTNEKYAQRDLMSPQTPADVSVKVTNDFRNANKSMALQLINELTEIYEIEQQLMPKLGYKMYLINVKNTPTDEKALNKYAGSGYELFQIKGTSHYPMIESPELFNETLQKVINKMSRG